MTNYERIKNMSVYELANVLDLLVSCDGIRCSNCFWRGGICNEGRSTTLWLKSEAKND